MRFVIWDRARGLQTINVSTCLLPDLEKIVVEYIGSPYHDRTVSEIKLFHVYHSYSRCMSQMLRLWSLLP